MSDENHDRREFMQQVGSAAALGFFGGTRDQVPESTNELEDMTISKEQLFSKFIEHTSVSEESIDMKLTRHGSEFVFLTQLQKIDQSFESARSAHSSFFQGEDPTNAELVVGSAAVRTSSPYDQSVVKEAMATFFNEFVRQYDQETDDQTEFEQGTVHAEQYSDWHYRMEKSYHVGDQGPFSRAFEERIRLQFFDHTFLMALVFGPDSIIHQPVDPLVDSFAAFQRTQHLSAEQ